MMTSGQYPIPHPQAAARVIDGEAVVVLAESGEVQVLNEVGSRIWELMDGQRSAADIARAIAAEFDVSPEEASADTAEFLGQLVEERAVVLRDCPAADQRPPE